MFVRKFTLILYDVNFHNCYDVTTGVDGGRHVQDNAGREELRPGGHQGEDGRRPGGGAGQARGEEGRPGHGEAGLHQEVQHPRQLV